VKRTLYLSLSAGGEHTAALGRLDTRFASYRRAIVVGEHFVCTDKVQGPDRILSVDESLLAAELARLAPRVRPGDVLVANMEDGHPYYGKDYAEACGTFAKAVRSFETPKGVPIGSGCYGVFKATQSATGNVVYHSKPPYRSPMVDFDRPADMLTREDAYIVGEFYLANVSTTDGATPQPGRVRLSDQQAWIRRDLQRLRYYANGRPVLAMVNPLYSGPHSRKGQPLTARDVRLLCDEIASTPTAIPVLWMHLDKDNSDEASVIQAVTLWTREWSIALGRLPTAAAL
jgi:hypothetical protein